MADLNRALKLLRDNVDALNCMKRSKLNSQDAVSVAEKLESRMVDVESILGDRLVGNDEIIKQCGFLEEPRRLGLLDLLRVCFEEGIACRSSMDLQQPVVKVYFCVLRVLLIGTINTKQICSEAAKKQTATLILLTLSRPEFIDCRHSDSFEAGLPRYLVRCLMIIHNLMQQCNWNVECVRTLGGEHVLRKYFDSRNNVIALNSLLAYTHLVSQPTGSEVAINDRLLSHIRQEMPYKLARVRTHLGEYFLAGMCAYLARLIRCSDAFGQALVAVGLLDFITAILNAAGPPPGANTAKLREKEPGRQYTALVCEWALADEKRKAVGVCLALLASSDCAADNAAAVKRHPTLLKALEDAKKLSTPMKEACNNALQLIRKVPTTAVQLDLTTSPVHSISRLLHSNVTTLPYCPETPSLTPSEPASPVSTHSATSPTGSSTENTHVLISYSKAFKPELVLSIADALKSAGLDCCFADTQTQVDAAEEMASVTDRASAIVVCYSKAYYDDSACHAQIYYAVEKKKPIIPVQLENFRPRGWLGLSLSGKSFIDFTSSEADSTAFDMQLKMLMDAIRAECHREESELLEMVKDRLLP